jgi:ABC-type ATPase with predicted acetyltransferase domain
MTEYNCKKCGHLWNSNIIPKVCPRCHLDWRIERKYKIKIQGNVKDIIKYIDELKQQYKTVGDIILQMEKDVKFT